MTEESNRAVDEELLEILVCPACHSAVELVGDSAILCQGCGLKYPVRDGIPVMLVEEAEETADEAENE